MGQKVIGCLQMENWEGFKLYPSSLSAIGKDCDGGRDWGQEEKGMTEDKMAGWHHWMELFFCLKIRIVYQPLLTQL